MTEDTMKRHDFSPMNGNLATSSESLQWYVPAEAPHLMGPLALAYLGDTVHDLFVRQYVLSLPNRRPHRLHQAATRYVSAKAQARVTRAMEPMLSEEEREMLRRGRNAKGHAAPKNTDVQDYRMSTGFECLIGYLFLSRRYERLNELLQWSLKFLEEEAKNE
jgi:ribonuclease-3 family protein